MNVDFPVILQATLGLMKQAENFKKLSGAQKKSKVLVGIQAKFHVDRDLLLIIGEVLT